MRVFGMEALIRSVHDGDTAYGYVDQGIGIWNYGLSKSGMGLRLWGCNARELKQEGGPEARDHLAALLPVGMVIPIVCRAWDKWNGRLDVSITLRSGQDLVEHLIDQQWVAPWDGTGEKPVPPWPRSVT